MRKTTQLDLPTEGGRKRRRPVGSVPGERYRRLKMWATPPYWCLVVLLLAPSTVSAFSPSPFACINHRNWHPSQQHQSHIVISRLAASPFGAATAVEEDIVKSTTSKSKTKRKRRNKKKVSPPVTETETLESDASSYFFSRLGLGQYEKEKEEEVPWDPQDFGSDIPPPQLQSMTVDFPPWLERYFCSDDDNERCELIEISTSKLQDLQETLLRHGFSSEEIQEILETMAFYCDRDSNGNDQKASVVPLLHGMMDFVQLILAENNHYETAMDQDNVPSHLHHDMFASKDVLVAGIIHYAECVAARQEGIYDWFATSQMVNRIAQIKDDMSSTRFLLSDASSQKSNAPITSSPSSEKEITRDKAVNDDKKIVLRADEDNYSKPAKANDDEQRYPPHVSANAKSIAASAATIKRAEILANTILGVGNSRRLTKEEAEGLRGLLLSSMEDWRALAIRCIASLFRLEGILEQQQQQQQQRSINTSELDANQNPSNTYQPLLPGLRSPEVVHTAQEALLVYGTLAQRLGMHQLKAKIEERAFRILYRRQYRAVSSVYHQNGQAMQAIRSYLSQNVQDLLYSDASLMANVEQLQVSSRVKEPYSFWKKLLKSKAKQRLSDGSKGNLSLTQVQDGIALRVILKAKKASPEESEETARAREKLLCYYVQHLIRKQWPAKVLDGKEDRLKDYIQYPKPNGYQSLHYTASLTYHDQEFPFEVQVRSEEMHRIAEYGVAAHWDYKLASSVAPTTVTTKVRPAGNGGDKHSLRAIQETATTTAKKVDQAALKTITLPPASFEDVDVILDSKAVPTQPDILDESEKLSPLQKLETKSTSDQLEYIDALVTERQSLVQELVYVFVAGAAPLTLEQGQLVILDSGSCIRDALAYMKEKAPAVLEPASLSDATSAQKSGNRGETFSSAVEPRVWKNGRLAEVDDTIRNGDVILIEIGEAELQRN